MKTPRPSYKNIRQNTHYLPAHNLPITPLRRAPRSLTPVLRLTNATCLTWLYFFYPLWKFFYFVQLLDLLSYQHRYILQLAAVSPRYHLNISYFCPKKNKLAISLFSVLINVLTYFILSFKSVYS